jgi:hypothetical protein
LIGRVCGVCFRRRPDDCLRIHGAVTRVSQANYPIACRE